MQIALEPSPFFSFAELQGLKVGQNVVFRHGYLNALPRFYRPEYVWAFVRATRFDVTLANTCLVQADGKSTQHIKVDALFYAEQLGNAARPPTRTELRTACTVRETARVNTLERRLDRLQKALQEKTFDALLVQGVIRLIARYKHQRRLAKRRLRYHKRRLEAL